MADENVENSAKKNAEVKGEPESAAQGEAAPKVEKSDKPASGDVVVFQDKAEIIVGKPMPEFNTGPNKAYRAYSKDANKTPLVAIVCERHSLPRRASSDIYATINNPSLAQIFAKGVVYWPMAKKELFVIIYVDNFGKPLIRPGMKETLGWRQEEVMNMVVTPMIAVLQDFRDRDFVHGAIRPQNMFDGGSSNKNAKIILGDCLSAPPSSTQPVIYETIHRGMANPIARGKGMVTDDLYALGVSIAVIMRHSNPLEGLTDREIIERKAMQGSYAAITGKDRFKGEILELLRGLLHDDASQRWTLDEVLAWMDGRRLSPKQATVIKKAPRPFALGERRYSTAQMMAMDIDTHLKELKQSIADESLMNWVERSLEDEELAERVQKAILDSRQQSTGAGYENCLASNVSIAMDPDAPLRFKGKAMIGEGIGHAVVEAINLNQSVTPYIEVFLNSLAFNWLAVQNAALIDVTALFTKFEFCKRYLKNSKFGEGLERAIYVLSAEAPCMSEIVKDYYIMGPDDLLMAFEDLCKKGKAPASFLDKHVVAFLCERDSKVIEPYLFDLNTHENHRVVAANLKCLAAIQKRYNTGNMPALAKVLAPRLQVLAKRYHDRNVQEKMKESIAEFQGSGDIMKITGIFENPEVIKKDYVAFKRAMLEYKTIEDEGLQLDVQMQSADKYGRKTGQEISAIVSCILAALFCLGTAMLFMSDKPGF